MDFGLIDHLLLGLLTVALPLFASLVVYPRHLAALREGRPGHRLRMYRRTIAAQWTAAAVAVGVWLHAERPLDDLGLGLPGGRWFTVAAILVALIVFLLHRQLRFVRRDDELAQKLREQFETTAPFAPRNAQQMRWFVGVGITAGVCEELLMRGYLIAYLEHFFGLTAAVIASSLVFGLGHLYQGPPGVLKTTVAGLVVAGVYLLSGSLWLPMILHAFVDINAGQLSRLVHEEEP